MKPTVPDNIYKPVFDNAKNWWVMSSIAYMIGSIFASIYLLSILPTLFSLLIFLAGMIGFKLSEMRRVV